jgi:putative transposase
VTKYRRGVFTKEAIDDLSTIFTGVCLYFGAELSAFDGEHDHVHRLVNDPPKVSVSVLINTLKGVSSRMIGQKQYPSVSKKRWGTQSTIALWSPSYFAPSCGGSPIAIIGQYIEQTGHLWCPRYSSSPLTERISAHPVKKIEVACETRQSADFLIVTRAYARRNGQNGTKV